MVYDCFLWDMLKNIVSFYDNHETFLVMSHVLSHTSRSRKLEMTKSSIGRKSRPGMYCFQESLSTQNMSIGNSVTKNCTFGVFSVRIKDAIVTTAKDQPWLGERF